MLVLLTYFHLGILLYAQADTVPHLSGVETSVFPSLADLYQGSWRKGCSHTIVTSAT